MTDRDRKPQDKPSLRPVPEERSQAEVRGFASPVCYAMDVDPGYWGYMSDTELSELLNVLLEAERAGAKVLAAWEQEAGDEPLRRLLGAVKRDEARFSAMLTRLVQRQGRTPSRNTGAFYEKAMAMNKPLVERLAFLNRGQVWVIRRLREALPRIHDDVTHAELQTMLEVHEANVARCDEAILGQAP